MAVITISNTGGNWNSTGTWVGGVVPTTTDSILATATSGQLTVNVNASILSMDLSLYTSTLTINSTITLTTTGAGSTSTLGSSMSYSFLGSGTNQGSITKGANAQTYTMNGTTPIPRFKISTAVTTYGSNFYVVNYEPQSSQAINGNTVYISGNFNAGFASLLGTTIHRFIGTGTLQLLVLQSGEFIIDCSGGTATISPTPSQGIGIGSAQINTNVTFRHLSGTIVNPVFRPNFNVGTSTHTLDLISGTTWDLWGFLNLGSTTSTNVTLTNATSFNRFILDYDQPTSASFVLAGNTFNINEFGAYLGIANSGGSYYKGGLDVCIASGITVNVSNVIDLNSGLNAPNPTQTPNLKIRGLTSGTQSILNVNTYSQYVSNTAFTDINCSGGNTLYGQNLTLSNTTKISQYTLPPTGGGETASVFIS